MWCGRFIDWKHPDDAVELARKLKENGYDFSLNMVGTGVMEEELKALTLKYGLEDRVHFLGSMPPEKVREYMEESEIFLFTSDRGEGWGAVLNEAMNSGCAVVASNEIGSVSYLIKEGINGIVYETGDIDMLYEKAKYLFDNHDKAAGIGVSACTTIAKEWNAVVATDRLYDLVSRVLLSKKENVYTSGPCSLAEPISHMEL